MAANERNQPSRPDEPPARMPPPAHGVGGRWVVLAIVGAGLVLALVGLRYRVFTPDRPPVYVEPK